MWFCHPDICGLPLPPVSIEQMVSGLLYEGYRQFSVCRHRYDRAFTPCEANNGRKISLELHGEFLGKSGHQCTLIPTTIYSDVAPSATCYGAYGKLYQRPRDKLENTTCLMIGQEVVVVDKYPNGV